MNLPRALAIILSLASLQAAGITISGGITANNVPQSLLFSWNTPLAVDGTNWSPGESIAITLHGPLNSPGVAPADLALGTFTADSQGNLSAAPVIPYDGGIVGPTARIPRPGLYEVHATGATSGDTVAADNINLCPATYTGDNPFDWGHERGGRMGVLPGSFQQFSPELFDPEWPAVWDELPVEAYGAIAPTGADGGRQPSQISPEDNPATHYAHDGNFFLVPDPAYQWLVGTANYYTGDPDAAGQGRLEIEWETQNGSSTAAYGQGNIGMPLWATPTSGDRVYAVGRWILDAGHPEVGDRTEMHPPRLLAVMRQRPAISTSGASAAQVDIFASGHGGGANRMPPGLSTILNQGGSGGGRLQDALTPADQKTYYQAGPLSPLLTALVAALVQQVTGQLLAAPIFAMAGPSAFPWGTPAAEEHPINDMDYDFDVPLPPKPDGATTVLVESTTQPQHTTSIAETVTFTDTTAHIHLPYNGADNGIYARTLKFFWDTATPPANHFRVTIQRLNVIDTPGKWQLWADISGQWSYLGPQQTTAGATITLPANPVDVYLGPADTLRIFVQGYRAACLDDSFGTLFGMTSYQAGLDFVSRCGPINNDDLGGALLDQPPAPGAYTLTAADSTGNSHFSVDITIDAP